jgi:hypothetical protein
MEPKESKSKKHFYYSMVKSGVRLIGYALMTASGHDIIVLAGILLAGAEVLGIMEEL